MVRARPRARVQSREVAAGAHGDQVGLRGVHAGAVPHVLVPDAARVATRRAELAVVRQVLSPERRTARHVDVEAIGRHRAQAARPIADAVVVARAGANPEHEVHAHLQAAGAGEERIRRDVEARRRAGELRRVAPRLDEGGRRVESHRARQAGILVEREGVVEPVHAAHRDQAGGGAAELHDALRGLVGDVHVPVPVRRHAEHLAEDPGETGLRLAPLAEVRAEGIELLDREVVEGVRHVDIADRVHGNSPRVGESSATSAGVAPLQDVRAGVGELLDVHVDLVHDVHIARAVDRDADGCMELAVSKAQRSPLGEIGARARELLDPPVVGVAHVDVAVRIRRQPDRVLELTVAGPGPAPLRDIAAGVAELLDPVVAGVTDVDVSCAIHRDGAGANELSVSQPQRAPLREVGAGR